MLEQGPCGAGRLRWIKCTFPCSGSTAKRSTAGARRRPALAIPLKLGACVLAPAARREGEPCGDAIWAPSGDSACLLGLM